MCQVGLVKDLNNLTVQGGLLYTMPPYIGDRMPAKEQMEVSIYEYEEKNVTFFSKA